MFQQYLIPGLGVALLGALAFGAIQTARVGTAKANLKALQTEYAVLLDATAGKDDTIARLEAGVAQARSVAADSAAAVARAAIALGNYQALIAAQAKALKEAEKADDTNPDCEALLASDIAALCPARAAGLRDRASRLP